MMKFSVQIRTVVPGVASNDPAERNIFVRQVLLEGQGAVSVGDDIEQDLMEGAQRLNKELCDHKLSRNLEQKNSKHHCEANVSDKDYAGAKRLNQYGVDIYRWLFF